MDTNINSIQDRFSHDTIRYDDGELRNIISQLKTLHDLINTTIPSQVNTLAQKDSLWSGETKEQYLGLISLNSINQIFQKQLESFMRLLMG